MSNKPNKVLKFSAGFCNPCKTLTPLIKEVCGQLNITLVELDLDKNEQEFEKYSVKAVPTIIVLDSNGEILRKHVGLLPKTKLKDFVLGDTY